MKIEMPKIGARRFKFLQNPLFLCFYAFRVTGNHVCNHLEGYINRNSNTFLKDFDGISMGFGYDVTFFGYDVTFMADTSLQGAGISRVSPDSCFSDNVDIFIKKSHWKILPEKKVMTFDILLFFTEMSLFIQIHSWACEGIHIWPYYTDALEPPKSHPNRKKCFLGT